MILGPRIALTIGYVDDFLRIQARHSGRSLSLHMQFDQLLAALANRKAFSIVVAAMNLPTPTFKPFLIAGWLHDTHAKVGWADHKYASLPPSGAPQQRWPVGRNNYDARIPTCVGPKRDRNAVRTGTAEVPRGRRVVLG